MKKPVYLLAGGRPKNQKDGNFLFKMIMKESGGADPVIAYSGAANGDDSRFFNGMKLELMQAGAGDVIHAAIGKTKADLEKAKDILRQGDLIFISGGDVDSGMNTLRENGMIPVLQELFDQGKTFFGVSAGSIMLAKRWVRWPDPEDSDSAELFPCLGFAPVICDCHDEESGWEELQAELKLETEFSFGYGLATGSGIRVDQDGSVTAIGSAVHYLKRENGLISRGPDLVP